MTDSATTRNILIIYGFLFVMLSALLSAAIQTANMDQYTRFLLYIMAWSFALPSAFIGLGSLQLLEKVPAMIKIGFFILVAIVPVSFLMVVGQLLLRDMSIFVQWGSILFIVILLITMTVSYIYSVKKSNIPFFFVS